MQQGLGAARSWLLAAHASMVAAAQRALARAPQAGDAALLSAAALVGGIALVLVAGLAARIARRGGGLAGGGRRSPRVFGARDADVVVPMGYQPLPPVEEAKQYC
jgi:hypothetical protein